MKLDSAGVAGKGCFFLIVLVDVVVFPFRFGHIAPLIFIVTFP